MQIGAGIRVGSGITIQLPASITISSHPSSTTINYGTTATFSVTATATLGATLSYQWQLQPSGGSWSNIAGATSSSYTTSSQTNTNSGDSYRVIVSGTRLAAPVTSNTASLTVTSASITINSHPGDSTVDSGDTATFTVSASATLSATLSYQWQKQESGAGDWSNISGATSSSYTTGSLTVADDNTDKYRVVVSATKNATSVTSNSATLTVNSGVTPNTFTVANYDDTNNSGINYWGASSGYIYLAQGATFGTLTSDYITAVTVTYNGDIYQTLIRMNFFGTASGFTIGGDGSIDNDLASYRRTFTIGNSSYYFTYNGTYYVRYSDIASLASSAGSTLAISYDPNSQPSYLNNTLWVESYIDQYVTLYGCNTDTMSNPVFGQIRSSTIQYIYYNQGANQTRIKMIEGSFSGFSVSNGAISGDTNGSSRVFTINGSTYTFTFSSMPQYYIASGDALSLASNVGADWSIAYDPNAQGGGGGGGGGGSTTYTATTDYSTGGGGPPGISFMAPGGPFTNPAVLVDPTAWTNSAGANALLALTSGSTFTVSAIPDGGGTAITSTITLTSSWSSFGGSTQRAEMTSSPPVSTTYPDYIPLSVTIGSGGGGGGGGGGGTTVTLYSGFWDSNSMVSFRILATETANIALMDAIPSGATLTITDGINTTTVTLSGGLSKFGPAGPPGSERYFWDGAVTTSNANFPAEYGALISVAY